MKNRFQIAKSAFVDAIDINEYIEIGSSYMVMTQLENVIQKPFKMVILFGRPGTGKSILLKNLFEQIKNQKEMHLFETPSSNKQEFLRQLFKVIKKEDSPLDADVDFVDLVNYCKSIKDQREIIFLLDEAQMYAIDIFEKIRLISDTNAVKFIISLHQHEKEELLTQTHFSSRIWERIELKNITPQEQAIYIHKKLSNKNLIDIANSIKDKNLKLIYKYTNGNYRECNKLMFTIFEICEYYDRYNPLKMMNINSIPNKIIEMAGLKLGYINA